MGFEAKTSSEFPPRIKIDYGVLQHYLGWFLIFDFLVISHFLLSFSLQLGHTVMIANAKDAFNKKVTSGGKPVMDYLGASLVRTLQESVPSRNDTGVELHEC